MDNRENQQKKPVKKAAHSVQKQFVCLIVAMAAVFIIYVVISSVQRTRLTRDYREARDQVGSVLEQNINQFIRTYDSISLAGADVEHTLLPSLCTCLYGMEQVDDALTFAYGTGYTILSQGTRSQLEGALSAYQEAFLSGKATDSAYESLSAGIDSLKLILSERFTEDGDLKPVK